MTTSSWGDRSIIHKRERTEKTEAVSALHSEAQARREYLAIRTLQKNGENPCCKNCTFSKKVFYILTCTSKKGKRVEEQNFCTRWTSSTPSKAFLPEIGIPIV